MLPGSAGLLYCAEDLGYFTVPFITESIPEDREESCVWNDIWYLPFRITALGNTTAKVSMRRASEVWRFVREQPNHGSLVGPVRSFAPIPVHRHEWDEMLTQLGVDPERYEDLSFSGVH